MLPGGRIITQSPGRYVTPSMTTAEYPVLPVVESCHVEGFTNSTCSVSCVPSQAARRMTFGSHVRSINPTFSSMSTKSPSAAPIARLKSAPAYCIISRKRKKNEFETYNASDVRGSFCFEAMLENLFIHIFLRPSSVIPRWL
jgi:hypothetical protein